VIKNLFYPFQDDLLQHTQGDFQSSHGSCDAYPYGDTILFYENFHPHSSSNLDGHQDVAIPQQSKTHTK
jgi:hypothetical protein